MMYLNLSYSSPQGTEVISGVSKGNQGAIAPPRRLFGFCIAPFAGLPTRYIFFFASIRGFDDKDR